MGFSKRASHPFFLCLNRGEVISFPFAMKITPDYEESYFYVKKAMLTMLWMVGGERFAFDGDKEFCDYLSMRAEKDEELQRSFAEISKIYGKVVSLELGMASLSASSPKSAIALSSRGKRIGLDLGGSDIKATALDEGKAVYAAELPWDPKSATDCIYHIEHMKKALLEAERRLGEVDAVGISTSGVVEGDKLIYPSLFLSCNEKQKRTCITTIYKDIVASVFPDAVFHLLNDGDASALLSSYLYGCDDVLGLSLGTSLASGYVKDGALYPYLNELSKAPIDFSAAAKSHYSLGIKGSASEVLGQKGIVALAEAKGLVFAGNLPEKLAQIQCRCNEGDERATACFEELGEMLGSAILYWSLFLPFSSVAVLGRVSDGKGGETMRASALGEIMKNDKRIDIMKVDERFKRLGQSYLAALL